MIDIAEMHRFADLDAALVLFFLADDHAKERRLAGAVRPDHADDAAGRQAESEIVDQEVVAIALAQLFEVDNGLPQPLRDRNNDLRALRGLLRRLLHEIFIALIAGLRLRLPRARGRRDPFTLAREGALVRRLFTTLLLQPLLLLLEPGRIIALIGDAAAAVELENLPSDVVEEVAVMGNDQNRARVVAQVGLEPADRLGIEMIGGLVEQQEVRLLEQQTAERHAPPLAAR